MRRSLLPRTRIRGSVEFVTKHISHFANPRLLILFNNKGSFQLMSRPNLRNMVCALFVIKRVILSRTEETEL